MADFPTVGDLIVKFNCWQRMGSLSKCPSRSVLCVPTGTCKQSQTKLNVSGVQSTTRHCGHASSVHELLLPYRGPYFQTRVRSCFGFCFGFKKPKVLRPKLRLQLRDLAKASASALASASSFQKVDALAST